MQLLKYQQAFELECGSVLPELEIAYHTYGKVNSRQDNVIWVCHALTASSDAADWWHGLVGRDKLFDPERYFIVCANMLGSCYGSTQPNSVNPLTGRRYGAEFPVISIRDMVKAHQLVQRQLGINRIRLILGGSMGGQQALEWAIIDPTLFDKVCILASNAQHSPWGIAFNEAQRMAIEADPTLYEDSPKAGAKGLEAARAIAMLSYRNYITYMHSQLDKDDKLDDFRASSYQRYQGLKLQRRFEALSYISLSKSMDNHNVGRNRGGVERALRSITADALIIGIKTDILFPLPEQRLLAHYIPNARLEVINSTYGHDGFLIEDKVLTEKIQYFLGQSSTVSSLNDSKL